MSFRSLDGREYAKFKSMLEEVLLDSGLPTGVVDADSISPGSIEPSSCNLSGNWDFRGKVSIRGRSVLSSGSSRNIPKQKQDDVDQQDIVRTDSYGNTIPSQTNDATKTEASTEVVFLNSLHQKTIYTLPPASKNLGKMLYVKRTDVQAENICRVETFQDDKIDNEERLDMSIKESVMLVADSGHWHILSRYTPAQPKQQDLGSHAVSNVDAKVMVLTTS